MQLAAKIAKRPPEEQRAEVNQRKSTPAAMPLASAPQRRAVDTWLKAMQSQVDSGMALDDADTRLLAKAGRLYNRAKGN